jgi:hypothetical protein
MNAHKSVQMIVQQQQRLEQHDKVIRIEQHAQALSEFDVTTRFAIAYSCHTPAERTRSQTSDAVRQCGLLQAHSTLDIARSRAVVTCALVDSDWQQIDPSINQSQCALNLVALV